VNILVLVKAIQQAHSIDYVTVVSTKGRAKRYRQNGQLFNEQSLAHFIELYTRMSGWNILHVPASIKKMPRNQKSAVNFTVHQSFFAAR
jgi:hypothetical protein